MSVIPGDNCPLLHLQQVGGVWLHFFPGGWSSLRGWGEDETQECLELLLGRALPPLSSLECNRNCPLPCSSCLSMLPWWGLVGTAMHLFLRVQFFSVGCALGRGGGAAGKKVQGLPPS